jgi:tetratricopeptide (TPR) repeat protein
MILLALLLLTPPAPDALAADALARAAAKEYEQAALLWSQALKIAPRHFPSLFNYGFMQLQRGLPAEAVALLERAAAVRPKDFNSRFLLGNALLQLQRREDALRHWRAALQLQPGNVRLLQVMAVEYNNGLYFGEACDAGARAIQASSQPPVEAYLIAIKACLDAQAPEAFELAREAAARFPASARANFEYGYQLQRNGRHEEALPLLERAIQLDPAYEEPHFFLGELLMLEDRWEEAAARFRRALTLRPDYIPACVALGKALLAGERVEEAERELTACAARQPEHPQPHLLLSQIYFRLGDQTRAQAEKALSLRLRRQNPRFMEAPQARVFPAKP